jgi:gas vesicle protein
MDEISSKPFSQGYVLRTTAKHMRKSIDISIRKTFERIKEFADNQEKSQEVFKTLSQLHSLRKQVDDFQLVNKEEFNGE